MSEEASFKLIGSKDTLVDQVAEEIQRLITNGVLSPGVKLPSERELMSQMGVGRNAVREAVKILTARGLLEARPGVGTMVCQVDRDQVVDTLKLLMQTSVNDITIEHIHEIRTSLEVTAAGLAAQRATSADIERLNHILAEMKLFNNSPDRFTAADFAFHEALAQATRNPLMVILRGSIEALIQEAWLQIGWYPDLNQKVMSDHTEIVQQVKAKDMQGARQAMIAHLERFLHVQEQLLAVKAKDHERKGADSV